MMTMREGFREIVEGWTFGESCTDARGIAEGDFEP